MRTRSAAAFAGVVAAALFAAAGAAAQPAQDCSKGTTTRELDECYAAEYRSADTALNKVYGQLVAKLSDPGEKTLLQAAEQAWIAYRDKECAFETAGTRTGTIHPIEVSICLTGKTRSHSAELQKQLDCPEGDTTCLH